MNPKYRLIYLSALLAALTALLFVTRRKPSIDQALAGVRVIKAREDAAIAAHPAVQAFQAAQAWEGVFCRQLEQDASGEDLIGALQVLEAGSAKIESVRITIGAASGRRESSTTNIVATPDLRSSLRALIDAGWRVRHVELFDTAPSPSAPAQVVSVEARFRLFALNSYTHEHAILTGECQMAWSPSQTGGPAPGFFLRQIELQRATALTSASHQAMRLVFDSDFLPATKSLFIDPLAAVFTRSNPNPALLLLNASRKIEFSAGNWRVTTLSNSILGPVIAAAAVGTDHLVAADETGLWNIDLNGKSPPALVWEAPAKLKYPEAIAAGDIDGDGDLDLWLIQYKPPYKNGQFPTPYFDANDGYPSYLLRNDGDHYSDITESSGLASKRFRRSYSASLVDINGDGKLDLIDVSDFAGLDIWMNDGKGHFTDVTPTLGESRCLFGMAHAVIDLNHTGFPSLFVVGMDSPAATMLSALHFDRPFPGYAEHLRSMTYGNRLFLGGTGGLQEAAWDGQVAHSGWGWGAAAADFDNDGRTDIYIVNGHQTLPNPEDYEWQFWAHDIYAGGSANNPAVELYFRSAEQERLKKSASYGGWQANCLFYNNEPDRWREVAWLWDVAVTNDCRNVVAEDFDGDGKIDLAMTTYELWPSPRQRLMIYKNELETSGRWIGFRFPWPSTARSLVGAKVVIQTESGSQSHWFVTGDSYRSQSSFSAHFGLGMDHTIPASYLEWPGGDRIPLSPHAINAWNVIETPATGAR